jgi:hypothetical protein
MKTVQVKPGQQEFTCPHCGETYLRGEGIEESFIETCTGQDGCGKDFRVQVSYSLYVHEYVTDRGQTRYAVGDWDEHKAQYTAPLDKTTARLTGCFGQFSRKPSGMDNYPTYKQALRRARYLFGEMQND